MSLFKPQAGTGTTISGTSTSAVTTVTAPNEASRVARVQVLTAGESATLSFAVSGTPTAADVVVKYVDGPGYFIVPKGTTKIAVKTTANATVHVSFGSFFVPQAQRYAEPL